VTTVTGDRYAKEWVQTAWRNTGIAYVQSPLTKSDIYLECIPLFTRGLVRLPDHPKLLRELRLLHVQNHSGGRQSVDHPRGEHDDYANSVCGVLQALSSYHGYRLDVFDPLFVDEDARPQPPAAPPTLSAQQFWGGQWWQATAAARQPQTASSADSKMAALYTAINEAAKWVR
jgi:hypothetical protein